MLKVVMRMLYDRLMRPYRSARLKDRLIPLIDEGASVLDVGTGDGQLAHTIKEAARCNMVGLDVCLQPHSSIEVRHYDGHSFPFEDDSFDCVMMVDMLHHTTDIDRIFFEACRVSRRFLIVKDHYWKTPLEALTLRVADYMGNTPHNVPLPYNYLRLEEWENLFHRHNLDQISRATFKYHRLEPAHHIMVKLQTKDKAALRTEREPHAQWQRAAHAGQHQKIRVNGSAG